MLPGLGARQARDVYPNHYDHDRVRVQERSEHGQVDLPIRPDIESVVDVSDHEQSRKAKPHPCERWPPPPPACRGVPDCNGINDKREHRREMVGHSEKAPRSSAEGPHSSVIAGAYWWAPTGAANPCSVQPFEVSGATRPSMSWASFRLHETTAAAASASAATLSMEK
jgi:hypothetical protein